VSAQEKDEPVAADIPSGSDDGALVDAAWRQFEEVRKCVAASSDLATFSTLFDPEPVSLPGYRILREIHRGGQGVVYLAVQESTQREVAVKVMIGGPLASPIALARFQREVSVLSRLRHPNIVTIFDSGCEAGRLYYVMDYVPGEPLDVHAERCDLSIRSSLDLFSKICDAVNAAHLRGIIHRDLKPANIRVQEDGEPQVLDFGLAKLLEEQESDHELTRSGQFYGSLRWASPEQAEGRIELLDLRTDVYSLGVILYHLLTGIFPYDVTGSPHDVVANIVGAEPVMPRTLRRGIDRELETIIIKCLAKDPEKRYESAGALGRDIRLYQAGAPIEAKRDSGWYVFRKTLTRHWAVSAVTAGFLLFLLVFAAAMAVQSGRLSRERAHARQEGDKARRIQEFLASMFASVGPGLSPAEDFSVRHILDDGARRVDTELRDLPESAAAVHDVLGSTYDALGLHREAEEHHRRALELREEVFGPEHELVATSLAHLAVALHHGQELEAAEPVARRAVAMRRRLLGEEHADVAESIDRLAALLIQMNHHVEGERLAREGLAMRRALFGERHPDVASSLATLGMVLRDTGRYEDAEHALRRALELTLELRGSDHPDVGGAMSLLAELQFAMGNLEEAERGWREVIQLRRRILGGEHPALAWNLLCLCDLLVQRETETLEAESLCLEALNIQRQRLGPEHADIPQYLRGLARAQRLNGRHEEAEVCLREAAVILTAVYEEDHPETIETLNALDDVLRDHDRREEP